MLCSVAWSTIADEDWGVWFAALGIVVSPTCWSLLPESKLHYEQFKHFSSIDSFTVLKLYLKICWVSSDSIVSSSSSTVMASTSSSSQLFYKNSRSVDICDRLYEKRVLFNGCWNLFKYSTGRFISSLDKLLNLAEGKCRHENCTSLGTISYRLCGCCVAVHITCQNGHTFKWESSSSQVNTNGSRTYIDNLDFASAI